MNFICHHTMKYMNFNHSLLTRANDLSFYYKQLYFQHGYITLIKK